MPPTASRFFGLMTGRRRSPPPRRGRPFVDVRRQPGVVLEPEDVLRRADPLCTSAPHCPIRRGSRRFTDRSKKARWTNAANHTIHRCKS